MHKHTHETCPHDCLHYCPTCGRVYCCKCEREWGDISYYPYYLWGNCPWETTTTTCGADTTSAITNCAHSHE